MLSQSSTSQIEVSILRQFVESSSQGFGIADLNGVIQYANPALCRIVERSLEEMIGQVFIFYYPPENQAIIADKLVPAVIEKGLWEGDLEVVSKSGRNMSTSESFFLIRDAAGNPQYIAGVMSDTTELKRLNEENNLAAARQEQGRLLDALSDALLVLDADGTCRWANPAFLKMIAYPKADILGRHFATFVQEVVAPQNHTMVMSLLNPVAEAGETSTLFIHLCQKDRTELPVSLSITFLRGDDGRLQRIICSFRDMTEFVKVKQERERSEEKFRRFVELLPIPLCHVDNRNGEIIYFNNRFTETFQYKPEDIPTLTHWGQTAFPDESYRRWVIDDWAQAVEKAEKTNSDIKSATYRVTCKDGQERMVIIGGITIGHEFLATFHDVTEKYQAEQQLLREKATAESTIDAVPGIFYQISHEGRFVRWNAHFEQVSQYTGDEIAQMHFLDFFGESEKESVEAAIQRVFVEGHTSVEADFVAKDGTATPHLFTGKLFTIDGLPYLIGMGLDIGDLKTIEKDLRRSNAELEAFNKMAVGREKRMIELKQIINDLSTELGRQAPYDLGFIEHQL